MDDYKRIQNAIEFIENNLQNDVLITDIAAEACFSAFHFQRLFQAISGFSVHEYMRKRRLSEAADLLKATHTSVLDIAISFQYNSQEAFTRAFEGYIGMTPAKFRKSGEAGCRQTKINFLDYKNKANGALPMDKPAILQLDATRIIGYEYHTSLSNDQYFAEIPGFYRQFGSDGLYLRIPDSIAPNMAYGISCQFQDDGRFSFVIGEKVQAFVDAVDEGFVQMEIPEGKYAEFKAFGAVGRVQEIRNYIYGTWLPNSNYERSEGPDFEVTDVMNSAYPHDLRIKIYIPIA
ncbi:effector binding domain-containing protein [Paenibacillus sp. SI8]|uniref:AraC family transcriptional regulator n=1 Tax=unclassified Paenibacillus TaxID=185978 RepID=UPI003467A922